MTYKDDRIVKHYSRYKKIMEYPSFIGHQLDTFEEMKTEGIKGVLNEISPIVSKTGRFMIYLPSDNVVSKSIGLKYWLEPPSLTMDECVELSLIRCMAAVYMRIVCF